MIKGVVALISKERLAGFRTGFLVRGNGWLEVINEAGKLMTDLKDVEFHFNKTLHLYSGPLK